jgi:DNA mismatch repair protein MutS
MGFRSILFDESAAYPSLRTEAPDYFSDLNLDQVVESLVFGRDEYQLRPFFYSPLQNVETILYRHEILRELDNTEILHHVAEFANQMRGVRAHLKSSKQKHHRYQKQRAAVTAIDTYCAAVNTLGAFLAGSMLASQGFLRFREYLTSYRDSPLFVAICNDTRAVLTGLGQVDYRLDLEDSRVKVSRARGDSNYSEEVLQVFEKFRQGVSGEYAFDLPVGGDFNPLEEVIIDLVAKLYPAQFTSLAQYCTRHEHFLDTTLREFDREVQFYLAILEHVARIKRSGLSFCHPSILTASKDISACDTFDLALAAKLVGNKQAPVTNSFFLEGDERILIVSGANQGGKTTFARNFGQLHHLASIGCPVPGTEARLFLFDRLFTHFEQEESLQSFNSKLENDLKGIHAILDAATSGSIIVMNESFSSTTLEDALYLSKEILRQIIDRDILCLSVTFFDELASLGSSTVSMVGTVLPDDPTQRTFKLIRKPADGLAYASAIAEKYRLAYSQLKQRLTCEKAR